MTRLIIETDSLLSFEDAAQVLGVTRPSIYNYIRRYYILHPVRIGKNQYLFRHEVEEMRKILQKGERGGGMD